MALHKKTEEAPTIKTIAQLAGVSRGTVDRVLNRRGGVNQETAVRVNAIASELNYKPNLAAKSLSVKGACGGISIGILINSIGNPFFDDVLEGIAVKASEIEDYGVTIKYEKLKGYNVSEQLCAIDRLVAEGVDGIIITPINRPPLLEKLHELKRMNIPVVCMNTDVSGAPKECYVGSDYLQCGRTAAGMFGLLSSGNPMKLAVVTGSLMFLGHANRLKGFSECIKTEFPHLEIVDVKENDDNDMLSYEKTKDVLQKYPNLDGLFLSAAGIKGGLDAVRDSALSKRLYIITVDLTKVVREGLKTGLVTATLCQEPYKQGYVATRTMFNLLLAKKSPEPYILTETKIVIEHSL